MLAVTLIVGFFIALIVAIFYKKIFKMRIFQNSIFRQAKFLVSSPERAFRYLLATETGEIGLGLMPVTTGFLASHKTRRVWRMISYLCVKISGVEGRVLPICDRTYAPLDPFGQLSEDDKKNFSTDTSISEDKEKTIVLSELDSIAAREHDKAVANLRNSEAKREAAAMFKTAMIVCGIILVLVLIWSMIKK